MWGRGGLRSLRSLHIRPDPCHPAPTTSITPSFTRRRPDRVGTRPSGPSLRVPSRSLRGEESRERESSESKEWRDPPLGSSSRGACGGRSESDGPSVGREPPEPAHLAHFAHSILLSLRAAGGSDRRERYAKGTEGMRDRRRSERRERQGREQIISLWKIWYFLIICSLPHPIHNILSDIFLLFS